ncbi:hypothetical protein E2C01_044367 [Portunus trituberculatus]|uniref:Uncharacterized protein n=1 Tax=Portunus trituberculatus TaxID=210409 RepID=A0A5B7G091_PORTR|nr:hypothetical protein [Portunus trituberculatus]
MKGVYFNQEKVAAYFSKVLRNPVLEDYQWETRYYPSLAYKLVIRAHSHSPPSGVPGRATTRGRIKGGRAAYQRPPASAAQGSVRACRA